MTSRVIVSIRVPCSAIAAFEVFTTEIGEWWAPSDMFKLTPRGPGVLAFEAPDADGRGGRLVERLPSGKVFEIGVIRAWAPGERLVVGLAAGDVRPRSRHRGRGDVRSRRRRNARHGRTSRLGQRSAGPCRPPRLPPAPFPENTRASSGARALQRWRNRLPDACPCRHLD